MFPSKFIPGVGGVFVITSSSAVLVFLVILLSDRKLFSVATPVSLNSVSAKDDKFSFLEIFGSVVVFLNTITIP